MRRAPTLHQVSEILVHSTLLRRTPAIVGDLYPHPPGITGSATWKEMKEDDNIFARLREGQTASFLDPEYHQLREAAFATRKLLLRLNQSDSAEEMRALLGEITNSSIDESTAIFPPFYINYGKHTSIGKNVFINFDCVFLDLGGITLEDGVFIAPKVCLLSEGHPLLPEERHSLTVGPIHIKKNAWIGANATITQGVTIGENAIVAAGAVVTQDVPDNVIVGGIPAKVLRNIAD